MGMASSFIPDEYYSEVTARCEERKNNRTPSNHTYSTIGRTVITTRVENGIRYWEEKTFEGVLVAITSKSV